jgi:hypothetical protein
MGKAYSMHWEDRNINRNLVGKPEGKRYFESCGIRRRVILQCLLLYGENAWTEFM